MKPSVSPFCWVFAFLLPMTLQAANPIKTFNLDNSSKLIVTRETTPSGAKNSQSLLSPVRDEYCVFINGKKGAFKLDSYNETSPGSYTGGIEPQFSISAAILDKQNLFYVYKFQSKVILVHAALDEKGVFKKIGDQVLGSGFEWVNATFKKNTDGLLKLSILSESGSPLNFEQDKKNLSSFLTK